MIQCNVCGFHINKWSDCPKCKLAKIKKFQTQVDDFLNRYKLNKAMK